MAIFDLKEQPGRELYPGYNLRVLHSENMTFAWFEIEPNRQLPPHSHHYEQVVHVLDGELDLTIDGVTTKLFPGMVVTIPPNATHSAVARVKSKTMDVFCPKREDL